MSCQECKKLVIYEGAQHPKHGWNKSNHHLSHGECLQPGLSLQFCVTWCVGDRKTCQNEIGATWSFATKIREGASKKSI